MTSIEYIRSDSTTTAYIGIDGMWTWNNGWQSHTPYEKRKLTNERW